MKFSLCLMVCFCCIFEDPFDIVPFMVIGLSGTGVNYIVVFSMEIITLF